MEVINFSSMILNRRKENSYFNIAEKAENIMREKLHTPADRNADRQVCVESSMHTLVANIQT